MQTPGKSGARARFISRLVDLALGRPASVAVKEVPKAAGTRMSPEELKKLFGEELDSSPTTDDGVRGANMAKRRSVFRRSRTALRPDRSLRSFDSAVRPPQA